MVSAPKPSLQTVSIKFRRFGHGVILHIFIAHVRYGHISTSGLKSDVTVVFLDPEFIKDAKISTIRVYSGLLIFALIFKTSWPKMFLGPNGGRGAAMLTQRTRFYFWALYVCANFSEYRSRNATVRVLADRHT